MILFKREETYDKVDYDIYINGKKAATIPNGGRREINLEDGHYTIMVKSKDLISDEITLDIGHGQMIELSCGPKYENSHLLKGIYKMVFSKKGLFLKITKDFYL